MPPSTQQHGRLRLPISIRLTLWYGLSMFVLLGLFAGLLVTIIHWQEHNLLHERLFKTQGELMAHIEVAEGQPRLVPALAEFRGSFRIEGPLGVYVRLLSLEGEVWEESINFEGEVAFTPYVPVQNQFVEVEKEWHGQPIRSSYFPIQEEETVVGWLEVSGFSRPLMIHGIGFPVAAAILATVLLALIGGYVLARRALKPVVRLTAATQRITASELNIRLPVDARLRDELTDLAETFNTMIARLEGSFARERRFTADAAHELLNPLAAIRNEAEVALRRPRAEAAYQQTLRDILTDTRRLGTMVEQLLHLARIEAVSDLPREPVDVSRVAEDRVVHWQAEAQRRGIQLRHEGSTQHCVLAEATHLGTVLDTLLDNALKYTPAGGQVDVQVEAEAASVVLSVIDSGIGFEPDRAAHLFDRFHRATTPDVQAQSGSGLGLAIARAITQAYGGHISATSDGPNQGSRFVVRLPRDGCGDAC